MRVLLGANVIESSGGGIASYIRHLAVGLEGIGTTIDVLWGRPRPAWMPGPAATLRFAYELAASANRRQYDVVAAQGGEGALLTAGGPGRVVTSHGDERQAWEARLAYAPIPVRQRFVTPFATVPLYARSLRRADVVIALHEAEAERFRTERDQEPGTVHVVPNGCGPLHVDPAPQPGQIVFVGNWLPRKGSLIIPNIFRIVRSAIPTASLHLVGPDSTVLSRFHEDDRRHVCTFGFVDRHETEQLLRASDVLLMPSYFEGMPLAVLEAMSFGVPTVGFDIEGTVAAAGQSGLMVAPGDVGGCAAAVVRVLTDRILRRRLSDAAFTRAAQLTWTATAERTLAAYQHAASLSGSSASGA